jgi:glycosyltransferase involved in cell wall biosynthesis
LKICFTTNASPWSKFHGGGQIFIHNLAQKLSLLGHEIFVIYTGPKSTKIKRNRKLNYKYFFAPYIGYPITGKLQQLNSITVFKKVKEIIKLNKIDIINSVGSESFFIPKLCKKKNIKFVISIEHPNLEAVRPKYSLTYPIKNIINLARSRELQIIKHVSRNANLVVTPSVFTKIQTNFFFKVPYSKIKVINHGIIDNFEINSLEMRQRNNEGPIIFYGRLEPQKGVDLLIQAYNQLVINKIIGPQKLVIIGSGPFEKKYYRLAQKLGLKKRIQFKGWRDQDYIKKILNSASLCVLPSRWESFGLSIAESLCLNVPVVTTFSGSIPEVVDFGKGAWIAKSNDVYSLTMTMKNALVEYNESIKKAKHGMLHVKKNYSWKSAAKSYERLYRSLSSI